MKRALLFVVLALALASCRLTPPTQPPLAYGLGPASALPGQAPVPCWGSDDADPAPTDATLPPGDHWVVNETVYVAPIGTVWQDNAGVVTASDPATKITRWKHLTWNRDSLPNFDLTGDVVFTDAEASAFYGARTGAVYVRMTVSPATAPSTEGASCEFDLR